MTTSINRNNTLTTEQEYALYGGYKNYLQSAPTFSRLGVPKETQALIENPQSGGIILVTGMNRNLTTASILQEYSMSQNFPRITDFSSNGMIEYEHSATISPRMSNSQADDPQFVYYSGYRPDPEVVVYDEISTYDDLREAEYHANAGFLVIASVKAFNPTQALYRLHEISLTQENDYPLYDNLCNALRGILSQVFIHNHGENESVDLVHLPIFEVVLMDGELRAMVKEGQFNDFDDALLKGASGNILSYQESQKRFTAELVESGFNQEKVDAMVKYWSPFSFKDFMKLQTAKNVVEK